MKKIHLWTIISILLIASLAACVNTPTATPAPAAAEAPTPEPTAAPTATLAPTPTPEPIPCTIAFFSDRDGNADIFSMAPEGGEAINLTADPAHDIDPAWSPDGSRIAFVSDRSVEGQENHDPVVFIMNADGSSVHPLFTEGGSAEPNWSPDGKKITYSNGDIYIIAADGSGPSVNLTNSPDEADKTPLWSPDGSHIAFIKESAGKQNLWIMDADGKNPRALTNNSKEGFIGANWVTNDWLFVSPWAWEGKEEICVNCLVSLDGSSILSAGGKGEVEQFRKLLWRSDGSVGTVNEMDALPGQPPFGNSELVLASKSLPDELKLGIGFLNLTNNPAGDYKPAWPSGCTLNRNPSPADLQSLIDVKLYGLGYAGDDPENEARRNDFQTACDEMNIACSYGSVSELMAKKVIAIIVNSTNGVVQESEKDIQAAIAAGVPVILLDAEKDIPGAYSVTIDQQRWALTGLKWMIDKMGGKGQVLYYDLYPAYNHTETLKAVVKDYPGVTLLEGGDNYVNDPFKMKPGTTHTLQEHPDIIAIWSNGGFEFVQQSIKEESGLAPDKWPAFLCGTSPHDLDVWQWTLQENPKFESLALGNPSAIAYDAAYAAHYLAGGMEINPSALGGRFGNSLLVDIPIITPDRFAEAFQHRELINPFMHPDEIQEKWFLK